MNNTILNHTLNTVLVSFWEELFIVTFTILLMKRYDMLEDSRKRVKILIPVTFTAIFNNALRVMGADNAIIMCVPAISMLALTALIMGVKSFKEGLQVTISMSFAMIIFMTTEYAYIPLVLICVNKPLSFFNDNALYNFALSLPERAVEGIIIYKMLAKKKEEQLLHEGEEPISVIKTIVSNKSLRLVTLAIIAINGCMIYKMMDMLVFKQHPYIPFDFVFYIVIVTILFPVLNMSALWLTVYKIQVQNGMIAKKNEIKIEEAVMHAGIAKLSLQEGDIETAIQALDHIQKLDDN